MKRKNLEKAIILGLMVASVSVPVWAADEYFHGNGAPGALYGGIHKAETPDDDMIITNKGNSNTKGTYSEDASYNLTISGYDNIIINTYGEIDENNNLIGDAYGASDGIFTSKAEGQEVNITDFNKLKIIVGVSSDGENSYGMVANKGAKISIQNGENLEIISMSGAGRGSAHGAISSGTAYGAGEIDIDVKNINILIQDDVAIQNMASKKFDISSDNINLNAKQGIVNGDYTDIPLFDLANGADAVSNIVAKNKLDITSKETSIFNAGKELNVISSDIDLNSDTHGIEADGNHSSGVQEATTIITNKDDAGNVLVNNEDDGLGLDILAREKGVTAVNKGKVDIDFIDSGVNIVADNTDSDKSVYGLYANTNGNIDINTNKNILIGANVENIEVTDEDGATVTKSFGSKHSVKAEGASLVNLIATAGDNKLYGVIYAKDDGTNVTLDHNITNEAGTVIKKGSGSNYIYSSAHGSNDAVGDRQKVVAALYAQNKGQIDITAGEGGINYIETYYKELNEDTDNSERTVWAQQGGTINITGTTIIKSSNDIGDYENGFATNSRGIAITAGSEDADADLASKNSTVKLNYGSDSAIYGDIVAGRGGDINISRLGSISTLSDGASKGIEIQGNALAANGGKLNMDLGEGSTWYGRADDYQDAGQFGHGSGGENSFFNPVFSNDITSAGDVTVTLGKGSQWSLTGQSWITTVNGVTEDISDADKPVIDIANSNVWLGEVTSTALTIGTLNGNVRFNMHLDGNELENSDMIYIKNAKGEYDVSLNEAVTTAEINNNHDGLRFATVGKGSNAEFRVGSYDSGFFNVEYEVGTDLYEGNKENVDYNGGALNEHKPGDDSVKDFFEDEEITTLNEITEKDQGLEDTTNFKIIGRKGEDLSDGGKTVVNMSKVNYSNAVYMDRLNKRLGEARYINTEEDQGMWVRMRHDRIGKDNEFRIMNTMYELGYDEKQECDNGERRVGAAIDYMDGSSEYTGVGGSGDVSRKGIWLYDTWLGDKGHYSDFVAKWGHLSNDFTLYKGTDKITGDFSNNVYSISAEYGRKKDIGNNWYFEPQVQLQYARVTDANYTTSQGTEVSLDAINSLIARAGFRLGKDLGERSTVYFKADLLHEFLGDQDIAARDKTTDGKWTNVTYGNEGTWCDIGFGFATAMSKTSYAYLDVETSLGNDYEETYQINAGLQWSF